MLRSLSSKDASTCLRCDLRLVLRHIQQRRHQSSDESPLPASRASASAPDDKPASFRIVRTHPNHGRIRGKKGGQRRVESSEPLTIASLGQSSEVIVLRDLNEPKPPKLPRLHQDALLRPDFKPLTAKDIEDMSDRRAVRPSPEVYDSIQALRPDEGLHILTKSDFDAKFAALAKGYTIGQLRGYLNQTIAPLSPHAKKLRSNSSARTSDLATAEISTIDGTLQQLKRTVWHPGSTPIERRLPITRFDKERLFQSGRKAYVIESILRGVWALGIEEEEAAAGEMEFLLSPVQFGLLLTKNSETLRPLLESDKFYKNSRFQLYQPDHVIRIVGPKAEAEAISFVMTEAFASVRSADIALDAFHPSEQNNVDELAQIFNPEQLRNVMNLTRTFVRYDAYAKRLQLASFVDVAINDAHRLLVALLPISTRESSTLLYDAHKHEDCRLEPVSPIRNLPFYAGSQNFARWVTAVPRATGNVTNPGNNALGEASVETSIPDLFEPDFSSEARSPIRVKALGVLKDMPLTKQASDLLDYSIWPNKSQVGFWRARFGQVLHKGTQTYPGASESTSVVEHHSNNVVFDSHSPGLVSLLARARPALVTSKYHSETPFALTANLIPSPLEQSGALAALALPRIQLRFKIEDPKINEPENSQADTRERIPSLSSTLPNGKRVTFTNMVATLHKDVVQLNLPSYPADLRFERPYTVLSSLAARDRNVQTFVKAIQESMANDAILRAPPALQVPIPQWFFGATESAGKYLESLQKTSSQHTVPIKYLFTGFEYRESRNFELTALEPKYRARVTTVEAGVTGGRRDELVLLLKPQVATTLRQEGKDVKHAEVMDASMNLMNLLAEVQHREHDNSAFSRGSEVVRQVKANTPDRVKGRGTSSRDSRPQQKTRARKVISREVSNGRAGNVREDQALQEPVSSSSDPLQLDDVVEKEQGSELDSVHDLEREAEAQGYSASPEVTVTEVTDLPVASDSEPASASGVGVLEELPSRAGLEVGSISDSPGAVLEETASVQTAEQAPGSDSQETQKDEKQQSEDEPLSVRLRRMMNRS